MFPRSQGPYVVNIVCSMVLCCQCLALPENPNFSFFNMSNITNEPLFMLYVINYFSIIMYSPHYSLSPRTNGLEVLVPFQNREGGVSDFHAVELVVHFALAHVVMLGDVRHINLFTKTLWGKKTFINITKQLLRVCNTRFYDTRFLRF